MHSYHIFKYSIQISEYRISSFPICILRFFLLEFFLYHVKYNWQRKASLPSCSKGNDILLLEFKYFYTVSRKKSYTWNIEKILIQNKCKLKKSILDMCWDNYHFKIFSLNLVNYVDSFPCDTSLAFLE